ncbi:MAG TPA: DUF3106 domain-containing protein [Burkholderiaceae bacterium]|nr:DUF3106 domain-containing protein [Burkholderiaceae bacterium]
MAFTTSAIVSAVSARMLRAGCILSVLTIVTMSFAAAGQQPAELANSPTPIAAPIKVSAPAVASTNTPGNASSSSASLAAKPDIKPLWTELTPLQQQVLGPLAPEWNKLDSNHKSKWLAISKKYPTMTPEQQQRLQANIHAFATLTPEQRRVARESYARAKKLEPEQKTAKWEQYQQLPEDQKQKLAADAAAKKRTVNLPSLQNKAKTVEPLNASTAAKKTPTNHAAQINGNHAAAPVPANQPQPPATAASAASASTPAAATAPAASK